MVSTVKVTNIDTPDNTGNITFDRPIVGDGSGLTSLPAANLTGTLPAIDGSNLTGVSGGKVVQVVHLQDGAVASGTTTIPDDDTIPQITEGDEWNTLSITPTSATNKLLINVVLFGQSSASNTTIICALFQDTTAGALAATQLRTDSNARQNFCFTHYMTSGTTSSTTFKVRIGAQTGTMTVNGHSTTTRVLGGIISSTITITEIEV